MNFQERCNDDCQRKVPGVFRKASQVFDNCLSLPTFHGDCRRAFDPCYLKRTFITYRNLLIAGSAVVIYSNCKQIQQNTFNITFTALFSVTFL